MLWRFCRGVNFWPIHTYKDDVASLLNFVHSSGCHGNQLVICCIYTRNIHMCMIYVSRMYTCKLLLRRVLIFAAGYKHTQVTMCRFSDLSISRLPCHYIVYVIWINMIVCPGLAGNRGDSDWLHGVRDWHVQLSSADSYQEWQVYSSVAYGLPIFIGKQSKLIIYPFQLQHVYSDDKFSPLTISLLPWGPESHFQYITYTIQNTVVTRLLGTMLLLEYSFISSKCMCCWRVFYVHPKSWWLYARVVSMTLPVLLWKKSSIG